MILPGHFIKARFWPGEMAWARVERVEDGIVHAVIESKPVNPSHFAGEGVICPVGDIIEILERAK